MKRLLITVALLAPSLLFATPAQAAEVPVCTSETVHAWHPEHGVVVAKTVDVETCTAYLSTYLMPKDWDGNGWNETASPQMLLASNQVTITTEPTRMVAALPECGGVQVDLTPTQPPNRITYPTGTGLDILDSHAFMLDEVCATPTPTTETPAPTPTTESPSPTPTTESPTPTPTEPTPAPKPCAHRADCLPPTGGSGSLGVLAGLAAVVMAAGGALVWRTR